MIMDTNNEIKKSLSMFTEEWRLSVLDLMARMECL